MFNVRNYLKEIMILKTFNNSGLQKFNNTDIYNKLYSQYTSIMNNTKKDIYQDDETKELVEEYKSKIKSLVSTETMKIIEENLDTVKVNKDDIIKSIMLTLSSSGGCYHKLSHTIYKNCIIPDDGIYIGRNYIDTKHVVKEILFHELTHAASRNLHKIRSVIGFSQTKIIKTDNFGIINNIGRGINEGYTSLITKRYFIKEEAIVEIGNIKLGTGYNYVMSIAEIIELIIGREKMLELYFKSDLKGLISELSNYQNIKLVEQFILDLDSTLINPYSPIKQILLEKLNNRIKLFLYNCLSTKIDKELNCNNIEEYLEKDEMFLNYINEIENNIVYKKKKVKKK